MHPRVARPGRWSKGLPNHRHQAAWAQGTNLDSTAAAREADSIREKQDPEPAGPAWSSIKRHPTEQNPPNEIPSLEKGKHQLGTELTWPSAYK